MADTAPQTPTGTCFSRKLRFWNLEFESQSFLYRQVGSVLGPSPGGGAEGGQAPVQSWLWVVGSSGSQVRRMTAVLVGHGRLWVTGGSGSQVALGHRYGG